MHITSHIPTVLAGDQSVLLTHPNSSGPILHLQPHTSQQFWHYNNTITSHIPTVLAVTFGHFLTHPNSSGSIIHSPLKENGYFQRTNAEFTRIMKQFQHPDSIWTWKTNRRRGRASLWIPYLSEIRKNASKKTWTIQYKGGEVEISPKEVDLIMFYGASGSLPLPFIDDLAQTGAVILIHRRNLARPVCFYPAQKTDDADILTRQIRYRASQLKSGYIARVLVQKRFQSVEGALPIPRHSVKKLNRLRNVNRIREWEAQYSRKYWTRYFSHIGAPDANRRAKNPYAQALDAGSMFMAGILLRWVLVHKLSPAHGFLHTRTAYIALVYDLLEPYRYMIESALEKAVSAWSKDESESLTALTLSELKRILDETVYVPQTRQRARRKNPLHGVVLALRAYLAGDMRRFVPPTEGRPAGGRPIKISYTLPGATKI